MTVKHKVLGWLLLPLLVSCGGGGGGGMALGGNNGGGGSVTGLGGSGGVVGPAQGFGSIIINDLEMEIDDAAFEIEGESSMGVAGQALLAEGQQLVVLGDIDDLQATDVFYRSDIKGPVESVQVIDAAAGLGELGVLGQTVRVNATTRYAGGADLDTLAVADLLEVSGVRDANGALVASYVELQQSLTEYKVVGRVAAPGGLGFTLGNLLVDIQTGGFPALAEGDLVEVKIDPIGYLPGVTAVAADLEALAGVSLEEGERLELEGFVDEFTSASVFHLNGFDVVVPAGTRFDNGNASSLGLNVRLEVEGTIDANGRLAAERIIFKPTEAIRVEGTIAPGGVDVVAGTVTTAVGLTFQLRDLTELEDDSSAGVEPLLLDDLMPGDYVQIRGFLDGNVVVAAEIERDDPVPDTRLRAPADAAPSVDGGDLQLSLLGIAVAGSPPVTVYRDGGVIDQATFAGLVTTGTVVEARWQNFTSTAEFADELAIEDED